MALLNSGRTLASSGQRQPNGIVLMVRSGSVSGTKWGENCSLGNGWLQQRRRAAWIDPGSDCKNTPSESWPTRRDIDFESDETEVKCRILEAILLVSKEPLSARRLAVLAGLSDPTQARTLARKLNEQYDSQGHAFRIEEVAGGMQLLTRPQFSAWLRRLEHVPREELLSQGMLESLAIVAYRQPILRAEIEAIRGVSCDEVLRQLMQRDLIRICGRHEDLGRPFLYGTTKRFQLLFGLQSLDSLPRAQKIRSAEAEIASRLAGNDLSAQDIDGKSEGMSGIHPTSAVEHH